MSTHVPDDPSHDPLAARLRAALNAEADMVQPGDDGLTNIRERTQARPWWRHPAAPAAAAAAVLLAMVGIVAVVAGGGGDEPTDGNVIAKQTTTAPTTGSQEPSQTPSPSESPTTAPALPSADVYVYFMHDDGTDVRLYREVHQVPKGTEDAKAAAALRAMFEQKPQDPDYVSVWPLGTEVRDYSVSGDVATVDLTDWAAGCACVEDEAVQQLVYTVTANDPSINAVTLLVNGKVPTSKGKNDWSGPVARAPMLDVQGLIWLLSPAQGETVSSPVDISGVGTAFEGTISWEVYADGGKGTTGATGARHQGRRGHDAGRQHGRVRRLPRLGRPAAGQLRDPRVRGVGAGREPDPRRHQDLHRPVAVSASGRSSRAARRARRCPPWRCAAPSARGGTPRRRRPGSRRAPRG